jgi:hypothetical protein
MSIAKAQNIYVGGYDLAGALKDVKPAGECDMQDSTVLSTTGARTSEPGIVGGSLSMEGLYQSDQSTLNYISDLLDTALGAAGPYIISHCPLGSASQGQPSTMMSAHEATGYLRGKVLSAYQVLTTSQNSAGLDNGAATANGCVLHIHVLFLSVGGTFTIRLQHSTDNSTWVDLIGGAGTYAMTAAGGFRVEIATGTAVNRYLRLTAEPTGGGSPQANFATAVARRP